MPLGKDTIKVNKILNYWFVPNQWDRHHYPMLGSMKRHFEEDRDNYKFVRDNFKQELD